MNFIKSTKMTNLSKKTIHLSCLQQGMTVEYNNQLLTVSKNDVKSDSFFGWSFRGDASKQTITMVQFIVPTNSGIQLR